MATILQNADINDQVSFSGYYTDTIHHCPIDRFIDNHNIDLDLIDSVNFTNSVLRDEAFKLLIEENLQTLCECSKTHRTLITSWLSLDLFLAFIPTSNVSDSILNKIQSWENSNIDNVYIDWFMKND